jgi:spore germination cell wall hydrolase CwlJ-like protein
LKFHFAAPADWRALTNAAVVGSCVGLGLGAAYLAGGMARAVNDHARSERLAQAAADGFSEVTLQRDAAAMDPGVIRVAARHDRLSGADIRAATEASRALLRATTLSPLQTAGALDSSRELECLTQAVYFEARGETPTGQAAVAQVVLNRVKHPAFPNSVCAVVFQGAAKRRGCQFSFACDGSMRAGREAAAWRRAQKVASRALGGFRVASVGAATHFHTVQVSPNWGASLQRVSQVGLHVFYKFGRPGQRTQLAAVQPKAEPAVLIGLPTAQGEASTELRLTPALATQPVSAPAPAATDAASAASEAAAVTVSQAPAAKAAVVAAS